MHRLLADESLHVQPQLIVLDQRQRLLEHLDEELFARRQQQVQHVEDVGGHGFVGHIVKRQPGPIELDITRLQDEMLLVGDRDFGRHGRPLPSVFYTCLEDVARVDMTDSQV